MEAVLKVIIQEFLNYQVLRDRIIQQRILVLILQGKMGLGSTTKYRLVRVTHTEILSMQTNTNKSQTFRLNRKSILKLITMALE